MEHLKKSGLVFLGGLALGILAGLLAPRYLQPHLPGLALSEMEEVTGEVTREERQGDEYLIVVGTQDGSFLVTFSGEEVEKTDLLIDRGDAVTLGMRRASPFAKNPVVRKVIKPESAGTGTPPVPEALSATPPATETPVTPTTPPPASSAPATPQPPATQ
ncbi:MAG: TOBE domain-containing protein [Candidatus Methylomirabilales bacterium]